MAKDGRMHRTRHGRPVIRQLAFDRKAPDKYTELPDFKMEVMNILQSRSHQLNDEKVSIIKKLARKGWTTVHTNIHKFQKRGMQNTRTVLNGQ